MGGYGTWSFLILRPDWVASAMPICGGGSPGFARYLADVPIRTFHGLRDTTVDPLESLEMAKAVNLKGGHAELILFPQLAHNCWMTVYEDERHIDWLLSFTTPAGQNAGGGALRRVLRIMKKPKRLLRLFQSVKEPANRQNANYKIKHYFSIGR